MKPSAKSILLPISGIILFSLALFALHQELLEIRLDDIRKAFHAVPRDKIFSASLLVMVSYVWLSMYDLLSLKFLEKKLPYVIVLKASFLSYALSHSLGFAVFTGGAARYRIYTRNGLSSVEIIQATAFNAFVFWIGIVSVLFLIGLITPDHVSTYLHISPDLVQIISISALIGGATFFILARTLSFKLNDWRVALPPLSLISAGVLISIIDWTLAASVLYVLLPHLQISFYAFIAVFTTAQILGVVSHVPGGLGVFEAVMIAAFQKAIPVEVLLGTLLLYRTLYYLAPLGMSLFIIIFDETLVRKAYLSRLFQVFQKGASFVVPQALSMTTLFSGAWLVVTGVKPPTEKQFDWISSIIPLPVVELSHFSGSVIGIGLVLLSRGIQRRLDVAHYFAIVGLSAAAVFSFLRGGRSLESFLLLIFVFLIWAAKGSFYRKGSLLQGVFQPQWIFIVGITLVATLWLLDFSYKHVAYSHHLWWEVTLAGHAPRSLRALVGVCSVVLIWGWARILSPDTHEPLLPSESELDEALKIVKNSKRTINYLALLGDKYLLFNQKRNAFIMYGIHNGNCIAMGDPVGPEEEQQQMLLDFADLCDLYGLTMAFYQVHHSTLSSYLDFGLSVVKLGEEAIIPIKDFSLEGGFRATQRKNRSKLMKEGYSFRIIPAHDAANQIEEFSLISKEWMGEKETGEKGFSLGAFEPEYLKHFDFAVVEQEGKILAFANILPGGNKEELSVDLMRYADDTHRGIMDYMFTELFLYGKEQGFSWFNLGMAPLAGLERHQLAPLWNKVGSFIFRHGEHFYNFQGIRQYKEKFHPEWEPRYLVISGALKLPMILTSIAALISGGFKRIFAK